MNNTKSKIIYGIHTVMEAVEAGKEIEKVIIKKGLTGDLAVELKELLQQYNVPFQIVPPEKIDRLSSKNHQGVLAFVSLIEYAKLENLVPAIYERGETPFILVLDQITDVRNFGALARTAECAGVHAILIPEKGAAQINADALKTSAGALNYLPICRAADLYKAVRMLKDSGLEVVAATEKSTLPYNKPVYDKPLALILGSEETGISSPLLSLADYKVKIPIIGKIESLNVSVAGGILMYEIVKSRTTNQ